MVLGADLAGRGRATPAAVELAARAGLPAGTPARRRGPHQLPASPAPGRGPTEEGAARAFGPAITRDPRAATARMSQRPGANAKAEPRVPKERVNVDRALFNDLKSFYSGGVLTGKGGDGHEDHGLPWGRWNCGGTSFHSPFSRTKSSSPALAADCPGSRAETLRKAMFLPFFRVPLIT